MADGRENNGGARRGSGRRKKTDAEDLRGLLKKCVPLEKRESILLKLAEDAEHISFKIRHEARKLLLAYMFGRPIEHHEVEGDVNLNLADPNELKKKFAARRKSIEALDE